MFTWLYFFRFLTINLHKNMKPALRLIPLETWVKVFSFPWIEREELGKIVDRFFRNRKFAEFLQFCIQWLGQTHTEKHFYIQQVYLIWFLNTAQSNTSLVGMPLTLDQLIGASCLNNGCNMVCYLIKEKIEDAKST